MSKKNTYPFQFDPKACDSCSRKCCTGASGYIWIEPEELDDLAKHLKIDFATVVRKYAYREDNKFSLQEVKRGKGDYACIFFDNGCTIYEVRPKQCRSYPFWPRFKKYPREVKRECPGIELRKKNSK